MKRAYEINFIRLNFYETLLNYSYYTHLKEISKNYEKIIISTLGQVAYLFFPLSLF